MSSYRARVARGRTTRVAASCLQIGTAHLTQLDRKRHPHQDGQDEQAKSPDASGHAQLDPGGSVLDDLSQWRGNEARNHQPDPLLDPDADKERGAGRHQPALVVPQRVDHEG